ncbi:MAG: FHA domain-containing protein, partial [Acidobacteriota bacterium]
MPRLKIERRDHPASEIVLSGGDLSIGRGAGNALHFRDPWLSRLHARLYERDGRHFIEDVGSRNGSFVNGRRLARPHALVNGDVVELGDVRLSFLEEATGQLKVQDGSEASPLGKNTVIISSDELRFDDYQREAKESADTGMGAPASANAFLPALNAAASALVTYYPVDELVEKVLSLVLDAVPAERAALMLADRMSGELQI